MRSGSWMGGNLAAEWSCCSFKITAKVNGNKRKSAGRSQCHAGTESVGYEKSHPAEIWLSMTRVSSPRHLHMRHGSQPPRTLEQQHGGQRHLRHQILPYHEIKTHES
jgi:hypothetical protein